jgi:hypothetical protein
VSTPEDTSGPWYRNAGPPSRNRYHLARADWTRSGRALCGADVGRACYVVDKGPPRGGLERFTCKACLRRARKVTK